MDTIALEATIMVDAGIQIRESIVVTMKDRVLRWVRPSLKPSGFRVQVTKGAKHDPSRPKQSIGDVLSVKLNKLTGMANAHGRYSFAVTPMASGKAIGTPGLLLNRLI